MAMDSINSIVGGGGCIGTTTTTINSPYATTNDLINAILHGNLCKGFPEPPSRLIKIFISSTKTDFDNERQHLHEIIIPKLERFCNSLSLDLLIIDPHWQIAPPPTTTSSFNNNNPDLQVCNGDNGNGNDGSGICAEHKPSTVQPIIYDHNSNCIDPHEFELQLNEIEQCSQQSLATFFMCFIGHKYRPIALPTLIASNDFQQIFSAASESGLGDVNLLRSCYKENKNLQPEPHYVLLEPRRASRQYEEELEHIAKLVEYGSKVAAREGLLSSNFGMVMSAVHQQTLHALYCARQFQGNGLGGCGGGNSPTQRHNIQSNSIHHHPHHQISSTNRQQHQKLTSPPKKRCGSMLPNSKLILNNSNKTSAAAVSSEQQNKKSPPHTPSRKGNYRLIHQVSLQQGPTQQKISMPRQTSVSTNYELMQQPVDRMLCFIRQLEGVNFNNAAVTRFFDVTPTTIAQNTPTSATAPGGGGDDSNKPQYSDSLGTLPIPGEQTSAATTTGTGSGTGTTSVNNQNQMKQLYAPAAQNDIQQLIEDVILGLKKGNVHYFNISWSPPPEQTNLHQTRTYTLPANYIEKFGETVSKTLKNSIEENWLKLQQSIFGPLIPGNGTNFLLYPGDIVREAHSHLSNFRRLMSALGMSQAINHSDFGHLLHIRELMISDFINKNPIQILTNHHSSSSSTTTSTSSSLVQPNISPATISIGQQQLQQHSHRHQPIIVTGRSGSGKSTLLAQVFTYAPEWLSETNGSDREQIIRIVRQCGQSPSSNFASELLRSLCIQISIAYNLESHLNRSTAAHELSELALCFQELLKLRNNPNCDLLIILDDLHHLQSALQSSALLGWMPWNLPTNVHFICSVALESESVLSILRSRISAENFICLDDVNNSQKHFQSIFSTVQSKLRDEKRTLNSNQWDFVRQKLKPTNTSSNQSGESVVETESVEMTPLFANMLATAVLSNWESFYNPEYLPTSVNELVMTILDDLEDSIPYQLVRRICCYLCCTKYGLRETELFNLVHETLVCQIWPQINSNQNNSSNRLPCNNNNDPNNSTETATPDPYDPPRSTTSTWIILKSKLRHLLKEYYVQGQLYYQWRSGKVCKAVKNRYLVEIKQIRSTHSELAQAFFSSFIELYSSGKESESVREADELWYHLLYSGNKSNLKSQALLNIKFLNAIVQGVSVCYLRCILDACRSQILDWDIEQLYAMLKHSVHVVTQEPNQLSVEALMWLLPFATPGQFSLQQLIKSSTNTNTSVTELKQNKTTTTTTNKTISTINLDSSNSSGSNHLLEFLRQCYRQCIEDSKRPILHPVNIWLNLPIPPQVTMITSPWPAITRAVSTPDSQHLIICEGKNLHFYHLPTKSLAKSFEDSHKSTINCLYLSTSGKWLATGSEDNSVNIWYLDLELMEILDCHQRYKFSHHSAGVLCVTINQLESLVLSGAENGTICAVNLHNGTLITRLEHHKSMVTCLGVNSGDDVLVSGSTDRTVVIWSLDTFCILNEILLMRPVLHMDISLDSTFLLLSLDDNSLQVRALTTGTGVHQLQPQPVSGNTAVISYVRFAEDNCRCVVGYADGRLLLFDIHSARQLQTLNGHSEMITSILPQKNDQFLITSGGNKIIIWNFYPIKRVDQTTTTTTTTSGLSDLSSTMDRSIHELNPSTSSSMMMMMDQHHQLQQQLQQSSISSLLSGSGGGGSNPIIDPLSEMTNLINSSNLQMMNKDSKDSTSGVSGGSGSVGGGGTSGSGRNSRSSSDRRKQKTSTAATASSSATSSLHGSFRKKTVTTSSTISCSASCSTIDNHREPISCVCVSRDGQYAVSGGRDCLVKIWFTQNAETHSTLFNDSNSPITCVDISANSQFITFGSEDGQLRTWSITLSMYLCKFNEHQPHSIVTVKILSDSKRILSADCSSVIRLWQFDNGNQLKVIHHKPINELNVHGSTCFAIGGKIDNCLKYWQVFEPELEKSVSHSDSITCFTCTHSGKILITGSQDMSLKVWETSTGKLTQVLVGHEGAISCVATAPLDETLVVSGAQDCNLIVWDMNTGTDLYTLTGHQANVMGVLLTPDGSRALSYSEDNTLQLWDIKEFGIRLSLLDVHHNITKVYANITINYLAVWLGSNSLILPIIKHHNNSSQNIQVELPIVRTPVTILPEEKSTAWLRGFMPSSSSSSKNDRASVLAARTLKREQSFDSFYFEHMLHRGQSVDDFRKIGVIGGGAGGGAGVGGLGSPFGSREQLWTGGTTHDDVMGGSKLSQTSSASSSTRNRMISKLMNIGPKQKMLKKQQSMFACFPEFTTKGGGGAAAGTGGASSSSSAVVGSSVSGSGVQDSSLSQQVNGGIGKKLVVTQTNVKQKIFPISPVPGGGGGGGRSQTTPGLSKTGSQDKDNQQQQQDNNEDNSEKSTTSLNKTNSNKNKELINVVKDSSICVMI